MKNKEKVPFFKIRAAEYQFSQKKPSSFTDEELGKWLSRHYINLIAEGAGIEEQFSYFTPSLKTKFGIYSFFHVGIGGRGVAEDGFLNGVVSDEYLKAHPQFSSYDRGKTALWGANPVLCFRTKIGRKKYKEWIKELVNRHPYAKEIIIYFGDFRGICGDNCPRCKMDSYPERIVEIMKFLTHEAKKINPELRLSTQTWMLDGAKEINELIKIMPEGIGVQMNEPALEKRGSKGNQDNYLHIYELDEEIGPVFLSGAKKLGDDFSALTPLGDSCEIVDPAIGIPFPWTVAKRIRRLAENKIKNIYIWWGISPWVYCINHEIFAKMVFDPFCNIDLLIKEIALRDFGPRAKKEVLALWKAVEKAFSKWEIYNWFERLEEYTAYTRKGPFEISLTKKGLRNQQWQNYGHNWKARGQICPLVKENWLEKNYEGLIKTHFRLNQGLYKALGYAKKVCKLVIPEGRKRARQQYLWLKLLYHLFLSEYHYIRAIGFEIGKRVNQKKNICEEIKNCKQILKVIDELGDEINNIRAFPANLNKFSIEQEKEVIRKKIKAMRESR